MKRMRKPLELIRDEMQSVSSNNNVELEQNLYFN